MLDNLPEAVTLRDILTKAFSGNLDRPYKLPVNPEWFRHFNSEEIWLCADDKQAQLKRHSLFPTVTVQQLTDILRKAKEIQSPENPNIPETITLKLPEKPEQHTLFNTPPEPVNNSDQIISPGPPPTPWAAWLDSTEIKVVTSSAEWIYAIEEVKAAGRCGLDLETTGLDPLRARLRLAQLSIPCGKTADAQGNPVEDSTCRVFIADCFRLGHEAVVAPLAEIIADPEVTIISHNLKFDLAFIRQAVDRRLPMSSLFDTMLASQLNASGYYKLEKSEKATKNDLKEVYPHHSLADLTERHLGIKLDKSEQTGDWSGELTPTQIKYAAMDAAALLPLSEIMHELLKRNDLETAAIIEFKPTRGGRN